VSALTGLEAKAGRWENARRVMRAGGAREDYSYTISNLIVANPRIPPLGKQGKHIALLRTHGHRACAAHDAFDIGADRLIAKVGDSAAEWARKERDFGFHNGVEINDRPLIHTEIVRGPPASVVVEIVLALARKSDFSREDEPIGQQKAGRKMIGWARLQGWFRFEHLHGSMKRSVPLMKAATVPSAIVRVPYSSVRE
jgi:hypothetical protein